MYCKGNGITSTGAILEIAEEKREARPNISVQFCPLAEKKNVYLFTSVPFSGYHAARSLPAHGVWHTLQYNWAPGGDKVNS